MTYGNYSRESKKPPTDPEPIWRGVGCLLIFLIPIFSYALADVLVATNILGKFRVIPPANLIRPIPLPFILPFGLHALTGLTIVFALALIVIMFALFTILYSLLFRPPKDPYEVAQPKRRPKKRRR